MATLTEEDIKDFCEHCNQPIFVNPEDRPVLTVGLMSFYPDQQSISIGVVRMHVTGREFEILYLLARRADKRVSKDSIFACIWGLDSDTNPEIINVFVCRLRRKIKQISAPAASMIQTVWGGGYILSSEPVS